MPSWSPALQFVDPAYGHKAFSFTILGAIALTGGAGAAFVGFGVKLVTASVN